MPHSLVVAAFEGKSLRCPPSLGLPSDGWKLRHGDKHTSQKKTQGLLLFLFENAVDLNLIAKKWDTDSVQSEVEKKKMEMKLMNFHELGMTDFQMLNDEFLSYETLGKLI